ncbi:MFS transporter [Bacteroides uniformis]|nr:MFS transporter [Bacteroides uniformis]
MDVLGRCRTGFGITGRYVFCATETSRWLLSKGRLKECRKVLQKIEPENTVNDLIGQMEVEIEKDRNSAVGWRYLMQPWLRTPLMIAVCIMFFQQFVGINTVIYYSPKIFRWQDLKVHSLLFGLL